MSFFSRNKASGPADAPNIWPVTQAQTGFGKLSDSDLNWSCITNSGFKSETHTWYTILEDGSSVMIQVIWSYTGIFVVPATTQMTFKHYNPKTKVSVWRSVNTSTIKHDGQNSKTDAFDIKHTGTASTEEAYIITANLDNTVQLSVTFTRPADAPGFKLGEGVDGGISYFGKDKAEGKRDGFISHAFIPFAKTSGSIVINGAAIDAAGDAVFIKAIQGMRPDSAAARWNFAFFSSGGGKPESKLGSVRAMLMEFTTTDTYGPKGPKSGRTVVSVGSISSSTSGTPLIVVGQTSCPTVSTAFPPLNEDICSATHTGATKDKDTGYSPPGAIGFRWSGQRVDGKGKVSAALDIAQQGQVVGEGGLMEKVDVLAEIPYVIRKALAAVTGTKPFIYQYHNDATLNVEMDGETIPVEGWVFNEASFVSE